MGDFRDVPLPVSRDHIWLRAAVDANRRSWEIDTRLIAGNSSYRVLVVDDIATVRIVLARLLERMGHHVKAVESGAQALLSLDEYHADVIFSDISMPAMNGYEFVRLLRSRPDTRMRFVIAMTGNASEQASIAAGFDAHLSKPFDMESIQRLLNDRRITRADGVFDNT